MENMVRDIPTEHIDHQINKITAQSAFDDLTGVKLDKQTVQDARAKEIEYDQNTLDRY